MLIGNKYSGYSRANIRLYFDPVTIMAAGAGEVAAISAAEIAAAEAAAAAAAEAAAATAAAETAAATAAAEAAAATATTAAPQAAGIMEIGGVTAPGATPLTAEAVQAAATGQPAMTPAQLEYLQASNASINPGVVSDASSNLAAQGTNMLPQNPPIDFSSTNNLYNEALSKGAEFTQPSVYMPEFDPSAAAMPSGPSAPPAPSSGPSTFDKILGYADKHPFQTGAAMYLGASKLGLLDPSQQTFNDKPYDGPLSKYRMSPDFQGRTATPNIYKPTYPTYATGGIMNAGPVQTMSDQNDAMGYQQTMAATGGQVAHFAKGGNLSDSLDYYKSMMGDTKTKAPNEPGWSGSAGIARDDDPDTRSRDALTAAQIRSAKVNKRANLSIPNMKRPTPMGQINLAAPGIKGSGQQEDMQEAAGGGIMGASSLGGYAAGGNPRLLKGPGDGMSDNIPATIGRKQPARLADGEFVIPADVVSHLGNGSTDAGAKRLHEMMNKVRRDRTGNSKQGKQIVAAKYMPK